MFTTKKVKMRDLGEHLAACREYLELSLEESAKLAQIQPKYLRALEEGKFSDLPADVYVKGFLKKLAGIYGLEDEPTIEQYCSERGIWENLESVNADAKKRGSFAVPGFVLSKKMLTFAAIAILALSSLVYLYFQINSLHRPPQLVVADPASDGTVNSSLMTVSGKTEPGASVFLNDQEIVVDSGGVFAENLTLGPGTNQLVIKSVNKFDKQSVVVRSIFLAEKEIAGASTAGEAAAAVLPDPGFAEFGLSVGPAAAWIRVEADGREEYAGTMLRGATMKFQAQNKILLTTGNAGSTRVTWNGEDLGILGKDGEVIRDIEFTR